METIFRKGFDAGTPVLFSKAKKGSGPVSVRVMTSVWTNSRQKSGNLLVLLALSVGLLGRVKLGASIRFRQSAVLDWIRKAERANSDEQKTKRERRKCDDGQLCHARVTARIAQPFRQAIGTWRSPDALTGYCGYTDIDQDLDE